MSQNRPKSRTPRSSPNTLPRRDRLFASEPNPIERAARLLASAALPILEASDEPRLAIPGGSAMAAAASLATLLGPDWARVKLTWVDERCVSRDDPDSNRGAAFAAGLPPTQTMLPLFLDKETPGEAMRRVEHALESEFGGALDLTLLGMGEDGHIASIFPPDGDVSEASPETSSQEAIAATPPRIAHICDSPKPPANRMTLTRPFLATARRTVLVAAGEGKREALTRLLDGDPRLPASGLPDLHIVTDLKMHEP